ncbi:bifunctional 2-polyprenyl-6-hydroxyphenol methylase/3-demethylubiquinol 3-O-methyltransferase UbiG [Kribbella sp. VKM Ac-2566]|uniref:class I SAM-dependent methyltransferase n=1 Tax=Kribbella sp. VKM Ac-2566 TaxID=2512218 RepID=UPI0010CDFB16|nr:class I SAM-dependent methyltransferase [Kribbella sp. VKM Ac-2566]TDW98980.1 ubiquinone/menaquinone biosynthesis C-methylase UbiE [Kribbella sp. VKM Ac-2566]
MSDLADYYRKRAGEYDAVYDKPERQEDLARLRSLLPPLVAGRSVLEVAAGTGYWTTALATTAESIVATDLNDETLAVARTRSYGPADVRFETADAYDLGAVPGRFDAIFAGFFWSHVPRADVRRWAASLKDRVEPGGVVILADNRYVEGSNYPITRTTDDGDTYQMRQLSDGRTFEVLKNFPSREEFAAEVAPAEVEWTELTYFWLATVA